MSENIIAVRPANRIWITRDWHLYTHKIYRDNILVAAENISQARAIEIIDANPNGRTIGLDPVDFTGAMAQWTYEIAIED